MKIKVSFAYATLTFVNEFVKWSRPLNSIGWLEIGHPGWHFSKPVLELSITESSFVPEGTNGLKTIIWFSPFIPKFGHNSPENVDGTKGDEVFLKNKPAEKGLG